jgi:hypothetical protein
MKTCVMRWLGLLVPSGQLACGGGQPGRPQATPAPNAHVTVDERCDEPGRFLVTLALADLPAAMAQRCGEQWEPPADDACDERERLRLGLLAEVGHPFEDPATRAHFGAEPWYRVRADFWGGDLPEVAADNERTLSRCAASYRLPRLDELTRARVSEADLQVIYDWFEAKDAGDLRLPAVLEADGAPATPADMRTWMGHDGLFTLSPWTPFNYGYDPAAPVGTQPSGPRQITVHTSASPPECISYGAEECEGYEWITFTLDASGMIDGIAVGAAACPFVYVEHGAEVRYQGEVLRNLVGAAREGPQALPVALPAACAGEVALHLVEGKPERTLLDDVTLRLGDLRLAPAACAIAPAPAYCADDGAYQVLARGDALRLTFTLPAGARCDDAALEADGYYLPTEPTFGWITTR